MKTYWTPIVLFTVTALSAAAGAARADGAKPYDATSDTVTSADGKRSGFIAKRDDHYLAVIDGVEGKVYDGVNSLQFSADGAHVGYIADLPQGGVVVIDGVEGKHYIGGVSDLVFSPDGKHTAFIARRGTPLNNHIDDVVVIDGVEGKPYTMLVAGSLRYSPDGKHLAFAAEVPGNTVTGREIRVFVDGKPISKGFDDLKLGPDDKSVLVFSPDGRHVAYLVSRGDQYIVEVDGRAGKGYAFVMLDSLRFSPDGRVAYIAEQEQGGPSQVVVDGKEGPAYDEISDLQFSADGSHFTYVGERGAVRFRVTDKGVESRIP